jgi:AmiR/NasT family two-component response regulator
VQYSTARPPGRGPEESWRVGPTASLNRYAESPDAFDDESVELGLVFAAHTSVAWNSMRREQQFRSALASRDAIGQAKGILMERFNIDAIAAFELQRRVSQESNTRLTDIAERLVATKPTP